VSQLRFLPATLAFLTVFPGSGQAQAPVLPPGNIRYDITFTAATARLRTLQVTTTFDVRTSAPVLLSLPAWTPGAYEIGDFARHVRGFRAEQGGRPLAWDKSDPDTWRVRPTGRGTVRVSFEYLADELDNAKAWARDDFLLLNGTNVFLYPEGAGFGFPATVTITTEPGWRVATGMRPTAGTNTFREANYHDLVDMPMFIGRFDLDSVIVEGKATRVATWPEGGFRGAPRLQFLTELGRTIPAMSKVFGETPWDHYTILAIFEPSFGGGSALEHQNSHVGIYSPQMIGTPILASITAHEIFHAWNVKRLRPAELWPYRYDRAQPTTWLWVSEGITDYYADLALVRGGVVDSSGWLDFTQEKVTETIEVPPIALEDASLSTWIHPSDGTGYIYYPKGALAGLLIDILIRDASDNRRSLDDVMRTLYQRSYRAGRGFTAAQWWAAVREAAGGLAFDTFNAKYIDGREPMPWDEVLPKAGLRLATDSIRDPRIGVSSSADSSGALVLEVVPGSMAAKAGVQVGDRLIAVGEIPTKDETFGFQYRIRYAETPAGTPIPIVVERGAERVTLQGSLTLVARAVQVLEFDPAAGEKAVRVRGGLFGR
jgi:predicted metalloprotease with PDZ domain